MKPNVTRTTPGVRSVFLTRRSVSVKHCLKERFKMHVLFAAAVVIMFAGFVAAAHDRNVNGPRLEAMTQDQLDAAYDECMDQYDSTRSECEAFVEGRRTAR